MTFKEETARSIKGSGHKKSDVMFIGSADGKYRLTMKEFEEIANFDYDSGFGSAKIATDLIIYFRDKSYIARGEYDGSEWWEYNAPKNFLEDDKYKSFANLGGDKIMWEKLEELNKK